MTISNGLVKHSLHTCAFLAYSYQIKGDLTEIVNSDVRNKQKC
jgi:hypothetical protein